jgi:probable phosphoglycerate mutase
VVTTTLQLCLVRHGATDWSDAGRLNGWRDTPLNERGRSQARRLAGALNVGEFSGVWSSDLRRATETAELAAGVCTPDHRLRELDFGSLEGWTWEQLSPDVQQSLTGFDDFFAPDGESTAQLRQRVHEFIDSLPAGCHLVFTHGGVIRVLARNTRAEPRVAPGEFVWLSVRSHPSH